MLKDFKDFIMRGNVLDLAVAVIIGAAFATVVAAFTDGILMAFVAAVVGEPSFDAITIGIGDGEILIGTFLTAVVNFIIVAGAIFMVVKTYEKMEARRTTVDVEEAPTPPSDEVVMLTEIRDLLASQSRSRA